MLHTAYFTFLGVGLDASDGQLRKAYLKLARKLHPDRNRTDPEAKRKFQHLEHVYSVLADGERRLAYMRMGEAGVRECDGGVGEEAEEEEGEETEVSVTEAQAVAEAMGRKLSDEALRRIVTDVNRSSYAPNPLALWNDDIVEKEWEAADEAAAGTLEWAHNQLTELPDVFGFLTSLVSVDVSRNQLAALPPALLRLPSLKHLVAENNQLQTLPSGLQVLTSLERLSFFGNQLRRLPPDCFAGLTRLKALDLQCNRISKAPVSLIRLRETNDGLEVSADEGVDFYHESGRKRAAGGPPAAPARPKRRKRRA